MKPEPDCLHYQTSFGSEYSTVSMTIMYFWQWRNTSPTGYFAENLQPHTWHGEWLKKVSEKHLKQGCTTRNHCKCPEEVVAMIVLALVQLWTIHFTIAKRIKQLLRGGEQARRSPIKTKRVPSLEFDLKWQIVVALDPLWSISWQKNHGPNSTTCFALRGYRIGVVNHKAFSPSLPVFWQKSFNWIVKKWGGRDKN